MIIQGTIASRDASVVAREIDRAIDAHGPDWEPEFIDTEEVGSRGTRYKISIKKRQK